MSTHLLHLPDSLSTRVTAYSSYFDAIALRATSLGGQRIGNSLEVLSLAGRRRYGATISGVIFTKLTLLDLSDVGLTGALQHPNLNDDPLSRQKRRAGPPLPETLRLLSPIASALEVLKLGGNTLGGTVPSDVAAFSKLTDLDLTSMGLTGANARTGLRTSPSSTLRPIRTMRAQARPFKRRCSFSLLSRLRSRVLSSAATSSAGRSRPTSRRLPS